MTPSEIRKAYTDKTWLVWGRKLGLVQVVDPEIVGVFNDSCAVCIRNGSTPYAGIRYALPENLRPATAQELLKL